MSKLRLAAIVVFTLMTGPVFGAPTQWSGNGHWYEVINVGTGGISWTDASAAATSQGGYLATVTSSTENNFVYGLASADSSLWFQDTVYHNGFGPWLGGYQTDKLAEPTGHWAWVTGETWSYDNWNGGTTFEPNNNLGFEDYLQLFGFRTLMGNGWNDFPNNSQPDIVGGFVRGYVVEWNVQPVPEPGTMVIMGVAAAGLLRRGRRRVAKS